MASGTTLQALERLSWMPDRDTSDNGLVIAAQKYWDVKFTGGEIDGVAIGGLNPVAGTFTNITVQNIANITDLNVSGQCAFDGDVQINGELIVLTNIFASITNTDKLNIVASSGTVTLNGATEVTVNNTRVTADSVILYTLKTLGGTQGAQPVTTAKTASTSFKVKGTALDTSVYNYVIIN